MDGFGSDGQFRSVDMSYLQILLPIAVAEDFCDKIGRTELIEFTDLNEDFQPFQRRYTSDIIKIQGLENQLKAINEQLIEYGIKINTDIKGRELDESKRSVNTQQIIETLSKSITNTYNTLSNQANYEKQLRSELKSQKDRVRVLKKISMFLQASKERQRELLEEKQNIDYGNRSPSSRGKREYDEQHVGFLTDQENRDVGFKYFAGVVTQAQRISFERQVFLTCRGNSFIQFDDDNIDFDNENDTIPFVVFFLGDYLRNQLKRLCQFMNVQVCYDSEEKTDRNDLINEADNKIMEYTKVHTATKNELVREMNKAKKDIRGWKICLYQEKALRITLNKFRARQGNTVFRAEGWCPSKLESRVKDILNQVTANKGAGYGNVQRIKNKETPPTMFNSNTFTQCFQLIVDTYGVPRYKEFNPTIPTIITFPFLFGVMYGDIFHGSFLLIAGLLMVIFRRKINSWDNEMLTNFVWFRWCILLMGAFAVYCGTIYNDCMSIMINGANTSQWGFGKTEDGKAIVMVADTQVYGYGIDPAWFGVSNQLMYENSLKMKMAVILGVTQMTYGLFLKLSNHLNENDLISVFCEFVPQLIFMTSFFIYMCGIIFYKWTINWEKSDLYSTPNLITVLIHMVLEIGSIDDDVRLYNENVQKFIQVLFIALMVISIPWMLIPKPFLLKAKHNRQKMYQQIPSHDNYSQLISNDEHEFKDEPIDLEDKSVNNRDGTNNTSNNNNNNNNNSDYDDEHSPHGGGGHGGGHGHGDHFDFSEIVIHQLIHTIEYILGTISNTASYLRLWALSLAHAELSEVFFDKTIRGTLGSDPGFFSIVTAVGGQFMFLMATLGVLLVMDVLECFLHALRLHWVEFQNKFYYADGIAFEPFSYSNMLEQDHLA